MMSFLTAVSLAVGLVVLHTNGLKALADGLGGLIDGKDTLT